MHSATITWPWAGRSSASHDLDWWTDVCQSFFTSPDFRVHKTVFICSFLLSCSSPGHAKNVSDGALQRKRVGASKDGSTRKKAKKN